MQSSDILKHFERLDAKAKAKALVGIARICSGEVKEIAREVAEIESEIRNPTDCEPLHNFLIDMQVNYSMNSGSECDHLVDYDGVIIGFDSSGDAVRAWHTEREVPRKYVARTFLETDRREGRRLAA